ncbi:uncharacterized protein LY79DRAFT_567900 [Colletotrichum navitas]|uniref:Uncharacterized protein n=1 Tax=Colletotrichum navitas TaxID=681940 RepID=A0AAD8PPY5_9PEZI|nr:uncharacterized protein LY79DRAFT_567900 [Colletotrichum navitas]KAK1573771.1 hypothetical protein LY79DRAFT_567900 [Colletotrichum navitas]
MLHLVPWVYRRRKEEYAMQWGPKLGLYRRVDSNLWLAVRAATAPGPVAWRA